ncbi:MAG: L-asparaginase 1 [Candidatus Thorarchaeota archaeon]|nr:MAG: L-asparaginase 1 [Candidatus Thorarchaeota archaeon]
MTMVNDSPARVCLITTGGTIASIYDPDTRALRPGLEVDALLARLPSGMGNIEVIKKELFEMDSANAQPHHWRAIAAAVKEVDEEIDDLQGVVITHGTDTMTYSSAAVSFMVQNFGRPIVFTGAQVSATIPWSDGPRNLLDALRLAAFGDVGETCIVFNGEVHRATRAKKVRVNSYDAFDSMDPSPIGLLARDIVLYERRRRRDLGAIPRFDTRLDDRVFLLKVFPGLPPQVLTRIVDLGYRGIVIEGFGSGNIPTDENALTGGILQAIDQGCAVVISSQCAFGQADLSVYEVGRAAMEIGAMSALDMTSEAALVKLAWILGHTHDQDRVREMMGINYVDEMTYVQKTDS